MATIKFEIHDAVYQRVLDGIAIAYAQRFAQLQAVDPNTSKEELLHDVTAKFISESAAGGEANAAAETTRKNTLDDFKSKVVITPVKALVAEAEILKG